LQRQQLHPAAFRGTDIGTQGSFWEGPVERSFAKEVQLLKLGNGATFEGEGILAVTKAALQSGVSYVGAAEIHPEGDWTFIAEDFLDLAAQLAP